MAISDFCQIWFFIYMYEGGTTLSLGLKITKHINGTNSFKTNF